MVSIEDTIQYLNEVHLLDPTVFPALVEHQVKCNKALADHPTVQVDAVPCLNGSSTDFRVGLLGVLNGLFGVDSRGYGYIAAQYDIHGNLTGFCKSTY